MTVDLQGYRQTRMREDELGIACGDTKLLQQGCGGMPQMVQLDDPQSVRVTDP
jgi:hypothetical protein